MLHPFISSIHKKWAIYITFQESIFTFILKISFSVKIRRKQISQTFSRNNTQDLNLYLNVIVQYTYLYLLMYYTDTLKITNIINKQV